MLRTPDDDYAEDIKDPTLDDSQHQKDLSVKSRYHMTMPPDICSDAIKSQCFPPANFLNSAIGYNAHIVKSSSPASSIGGDTVVTPTNQFGQHPQLNLPQGHPLMAAAAQDLSFYNLSDGLSDQDRLILSDAEKFLRSREADMCGNEYSHMHDEFAVRKYYHPLYAHGICRWPGCEMDLEDIASFVKHLNTEHGLDDRSTAQARVQMQVVSQLESHLQKERDRLQAMMHHLYLSKQLLTPIKSDRKDFIDKQSNFCGIPSPLTISNIAQTFNQANSTNPMNLPILNTTNLCTTKKRNNEKNTFSVTGGLPYMLERAGLDVQQEIQRNKEFYKNADVRPPFTYASLIRQAVIDSPDKQLTLNEIYNWFQNTFCYFRRNAATWKNAIRTNLSLHKCFVRYEDDFGSFWMVDDNEFIKRRHLSRGRPRKYEPSSSPNSSQSSSVIPNNNNKSGCDSCSQHCGGGGGGGSLGNDNTADANATTIDMKPGEIGGLDSFDICKASQKRIKHNNINNNNHNKLFHDICGASECLSSRSPKSMKSMQTMSADDFIGIDDSPHMTLFQNNSHELDQQSD